MKAFKAGKRASGRAGKHTAGKLSAGSRQRAVGKRAAGKLAAGSWQLAATKSLPSFPPLSPVSDVALIYREGILEHYRHPQNFGSLPNADVARREFNASCGDELEFRLKIDQCGKITQVRFTGHGCAVSVAAASLLSERLIGLTVAAARKMGFADITELLGIDVGPGRMKCATLALKAVQAGIDERTSAAAKPNVKIAAANRRGSRKLT